MPTSQNGYSANDIGLTKVWSIPNTTRKIRLRNDSTGLVLVDMLAWFDQNVESVDGGVFDDWGYAERPIRGATTTLSNHASGTAADVNATQHPLGVPTRNTFSQGQIDSIHGRLRFYEGVLRWGGDYCNRPDAMHFEIVKGYSEVRRIAAKIAGGSTGSQPDKPTTTNVTIGAKCMTYAARGYVMNDEDGCYLDARQFLAWGRALGAVARTTEQAWVESHNSNPHPATYDGKQVRVSDTGGQLFRYAVRCVQKKFGLAQDGVAGPVTLSKMKAYGYKPVDYNGHRI